MTRGKILGGILLVSGTAIGAGMLALPTSTADNGFIPSTLVFAICWFFMTIAALLLLEINLRIKGEQDLIPMVGATLGPAAKYVASIAYLLLLYALICAYLTGSSAWLIKILAELGVTLAPSIAISLMALVFAVVISTGIGVTEYLNRYLALGLVVAYVVLISTALPSVDLAKIGFSDSKSVLSHLPLLVTAFGFSVIIPSLSQYLNRDYKVLRQVIIVGSLIPLMIYLLWEFVALGIIPRSGEHSFAILMNHHDDGTGVAIALKQIVGSSWITQSSRWFAIFAILTSLLGVSLALMHFLADASKGFTKKKPSQYWLVVLTYLPPMLIVLFYPSGFSQILSFAGIFVAVLLGILPALMVWYSRYSKQGIQSGYQVFGGKILLTCVMVFFGYVTYLEIINCLFCQP